MLIEKTAQNWPIDSSDDSDIPMDSDQNPRPDMELRFLHVWSTILALYRWYESCRKAVIITGGGNAKYWLEIKYIPTVSVNNRSWNSVWSDAIDRIANILFGCDNYTECKQEYYGYGVVKFEDIVVDLYSARLQQCLQAPKDIEHYTGSDRSHRDSNMRITGLFLEISEIFTTKF